MRYIAAFRITASALAAIVALAPSSQTAFAGQQAPRSSIPQESGAAGAPILRNCADVETALTRMRSGLGTQRGWIESAERQLRDAERGVLDSESARREFFMDALKDLATNQIEEALTLRNKVALLRSATLSPAATRKVLELAEKAEKLKERADELKQLSETASQGYDFGAKLRENKATLEDFLKFADESGLAEEGISTLALVGGPVSKLAAESGKVLIDFGLTMYGSIISEDELARARADLDRVRTTYSRNEGIIRDLQDERAPGNCSNPDTQESTREATSAPADSSLTPPLPEPEPPVEPKKGNTAMLAIGAAAAAVGAGLLAGSLVPVEGIDEADDDSGGSAGGITLVSAAFNCRYNAGGIVSSCSESVVTINVTMRLPVGSRLKLATNHIISTGTVATTRDPAGNVTFRGFSGGGWFDRCGPPVTRLVLINTSVSSNGIAQITGISMPVTCRD